MRIQIKTLGRLEIRSDLQELPRFLDQPVRTALLVHLAVEKETTRESVMSLLWPNQDPPKARHALSQTIYRLRKDLGEDWLEVKGERLRTTGSLSIDVDHFQAALDAGDIPAALSEYGGTFLAGWTFPGLGLFEGWIDRVQLQLARQFREANADYISELRKNGEMERALEVARRWVEADPQEDEAQHCLLELLVETGNRTGALSQFGAYQRILAADDLTPLEHTLALIESIRKDEGGAVPPLSPSKRIEREVPNPKGSRRGVMGVLFPVITIVLLSFAAFWGFEKVFQATPLVENRVLVVPLDNQTGKPGLDPVGRLAADWINQGLSEAGFVEVVPSIEVIPNLPRESGTDSVDPFSQALDLARQNQAGVVVYGTYYEREAGLEFHIQVARVQARELLQAIGPVNTESEDPMEAVDVLRERTLIALAVHFDERLGGLFEKATLPPSYESYLAYVEGFQLFGRGRRTEAIPFLERSHDLSPGFKAPLIVAGFAYFGSGDYLTADSLAAVVRASPESLTPYDRFRLDFLEATLRGDKEGSLRATTAAAALQPGGSAHAAAGSQALSLNRPVEALRLLSTFNSDGAVAQVYSPLWNTLTSAHHQLGDHEEELQVAMHGRRVQPYSMATLSYEIRALAALGRVDQVAGLLEECVNFPPDQRGWTAPRVMVSAAMELRAHGHADAASQAVEKALSWYGTRPPEEQRQEQYLRGLAEALYVAGQWENARQTLEGLAERSPDRIEYQGYLGVLAARRGDADQAQEYDAWLASQEGPYLFGYPTLWRARIAAQLGDTDESLGLIRDGLSKGAGFSLDLFHTNLDFEPLRDNPSFLEILRPKG